MACASAGAGIATMTEVARVKTDEMNRRRWSVDMSASVVILNSINLAFFLY
jgi:TRAP-type C4-dicarboxylate transport system permease large subunit